MPGPGCTCDVSADVTASADPGDSGWHQDHDPDCRPVDRIADDPRLYEQAETVFETMEPLESLYADHNELHFYTWSDRRCCLPKGATRATLDGHHPEALDCAGTGGHFDL